MQDRYSMIIPILYVKNGTNCSKSLYHLHTRISNYTVTGIQVISITIILIEPAVGEIFHTWLSSVEPFALHSAITLVHQPVSDLLQEMSLYPTEQHVT